jgi:hypothetical protein
LTSDVLGWKRKSLPSRRPSGREKESHKMNPTDLLAIMAAIIYATAEVAMVVDLWVKSRRSEEYPD